MVFSSKGSIRNKISLALFATGGLTLLFATLAFVVFELFSFKKNSINNLDIITKVVSVNVTPALEFNDPKTANEFIAKLKIYPSLVTATVYDGTGSVFSHYSKQDREAKNLATLRQGPSFSFEERYLHVLQPIMSGRSVLGHLYLQSDFRELEKDLKQIFLVVVVIFLASALVGFLISSGFQRVIIKPILGLYESVRALTGRDFSKRVLVSSQDELGELAHAFNEMLTTLEQTTVSKDYVNSIVSSMNESLVVLDQTGKIEFVNKALLQFLGYTEEEIIGSSAAILFLEGERSAKALLRQIAEKGVITSYDMFYRAKGGESIPIALAGSLLEGAAGRGRRYLLVSADIRELKRLIAREKEFAKLERERAEEIEKAYSELEKAKNTLEKKTEELAKSNKELEQFAYVASHDLQEPLRMVGSYVELIARRYKGKLDKDADEFIEFAVDGANRMKGLIQDLLSYSRVGSRAEAFKPVDCKLVLERVTDDLKLLIQETGAVFTYDDPLPTIVADASQLVQVLENLVGNAIKFRKDGAPAGVHVGVKEAENEWVFSVRDNGIGIKKEFFDRIFVIFQRLHHRDKYPGTGIGLAVCKRIVERHHGRIWLDSEEGEGTTFYFTVPTYLGGLNGSLEQHTEAD